MAGAGVSSKPRKQRTVALSTTEAEYLALLEAAKEAINLKNFFQETGMSQKGIRVFSDNQMLNVWLRIKYSILEPNV